MSAINDLSLFIDIKNRRLVRDIFSDVEINLPKLTQGDGYNLKLHGVQAAPGRPVGRVYDFVPLPDAIFAGVGKVGDVDLTGTFTLTYDGDTTAAISVNATASQVQTAINALASITTAGGVTVSGPDGGPWQVAFVSDGVRDFFTANIDSIFPFSGFRAYQLREGTVSAKEIQLLVIDPQLATLAETFTNLPSAAGSVTELQAGASGVPEIQRVSISTDAYDGGFTLSFDGETTQFIPHDADAEEIKQALDALSNIDTDGVTVTGAKPNWDVSFTGVAGNQNLMTIDVSGLVVPIGKQGILNLATGGIELLVSNATSAEAKFEVSGIVSGNHGTILQADCTILNDGIQNDPVAGPTTPTLATQAEVTALEARVDTAEDDIVALETRMDTAEGDITTLQGDVAGAVRFDEAQSLTSGEKLQARQNIDVPIILSDTFSIAINGLDTTQADTTITLTEGTWILTIQGQVLNEGTGTPDFSLKVDSSSVSTFSAGSDLSFVLQRDSISNYGFLSASNIMDPILISDSAGVDLFPFSFLGQGKLIATASMPIRFTLTTVDCELNDVGWYGTITAIKIA